MLKVQNISKDYQMGRRKLRVLHNVSLAVEDGEMLCIEGPSGAGKSTLLHIIGLLDTATEGRIFYDSTDLSALGGRQQAYWRNKLFGFVFQFYHLLPDFNALENVVLPALADAAVAIGRASRAQVLERGSQLLEIVGLEDRAGHRPGQLSGGERQRVAIARALMNSPKFLLCDEPTGNLDSQTGKSILDLLCRVREETGATLVVVTHDPHVAARAARTVEMVDGRIARHRT